MATHRRPARLATAVLLALALGSGAAACGSDDTGDSSGSKAETHADAGHLQHVDGSLRLVEGSALEVKPSQGDTVTLALGPSVEQGAVKGLATSGVRARVYYTEESGELVAASVAPAPTSGEGLKSYDGIVTEASTDRLVIGGDEGDRTFTIGKTERDQFEVEHMLEHKASGEKIRVYYRPGKDGDRATAYEDA